MIVYGEPLRPYVESALGGPVPEGGQFIGRLVDGKPVAVAAINHWAGYDCELSIASERGLRRDFIRAVFRYVFGELGCRRVTARIDASLTHWIPAVERLGFVLEGRCRTAAPSGNDTLIFGMLRSECRWIGAE